LFGDSYENEDDIIDDRLPPPPPGLPSRQSIFMPDEEMTVRFVGYQVVFWKTWYWYTGCIASAGILALIGHWFPGMWLRWTTDEKAFKQIANGFVVVEVRKLLFVRMS
jgi:cation-transporting ATPase 13A3/4/5